MGTKCCDILIEAIFKKMRTGCWASEGNNDVLEVRN
jgi:hypothetical protein